MTEILFTHSYFLRFDPKQWKAQKPYAPLATLYCASVLRKSGFEVAMFDTMFSSEPDEIIESLKKEKPKYVILCDDGFNYLTKMCLLNMRKAAFEMIGIAKQNGCTVIVSSSDSTDHSADFLDAGADFIIAGEAEQTLLELMNKLKAGETDFQSVNGLRYKESGKIVHTKPRTNLNDLDSLPFPAWDLINIAEYKKRWLSKNNYFSINMVTTRGCPFKCNWCAKPIYGNRYNSRSPENVVKELLWLKNEFGYGHVWFCDDIFGLKPGWIKRFLELVKQEGLVFKFNIQSRVDLLLNENNIQSLAAAGADEVWVGAESGSQKILDAMDKGTTIAQIYESTELMKKNLIKPCFFLQFAYPGENSEDIRATLKLVSDLMPYDIGVSVSYPLPGTGFYEKVKDQIKDKTNWNDSDELVTLFNSTFPSGFYRKLQRFVHHEFRKMQAFESLKQFKDFKKILSLIYRIPQSKLSGQRIKKYVFTNPV